MTTDRISKLEGIQRLFNPTTHFKGDISLLKRRNDFTKVTPAGNSIIEPSIHTS